MKTGITRRLHGVRDYMQERPLDCLIVTQIDNRRYLSGFAGSAGTLFITGKLAILATDFRYVEQAKLQAPQFEVLQIKGEMANWLPPLAASHNIKTIGLEAEDISYAAYTQLAEALAKTCSAHLISTQGVVAGIRAVKDKEELELIRRAVALGEQAFIHLTTFLRPGLSEKTVAWELEKYMREQGSDKMPFDIIVAAGTNAAQPHHHPSERPVQEGEPIIVDLGASFDGYGSDLTRTFYIGTPDDAYRKIYGLVLRAQQNAIDRIRPGLTGGEADGLARSIIEEAGYGAAFGHGLGHGVGMATHEEPRLGPGAAQTMRAGMAVTVEPGIYLPEWGGVRIEDDVYLTTGSPQIMSHASRDLLVGIDKSCVIPR
ncbi:MAG: aminopeptidase P family protein [Chloroflexi bacterium]|nr:aminopeptidase P family protein [Chloroflexota bacterium]